MERESLMRKFDVTVSSLRQKLAGSPRHPMGYMAAFLLAVAVIGSTYTALAQCVLDPAMNYVCSGSVGTATVDALSAGNSSFTFLDGTTGQITLIANPSVLQTIDFTQSLTGISVNLSNQAGYQTVYTGLEIWLQNFTDTVLSGSQANDSLTGSAGDDVIYGRDGTDLIKAGDGNDYVYGGNGDDRLIGGNGNDHLEGYSGNDTLLGNDGNDVLLGLEGDDIMDGGNGNDQLLGYTGTDIIVGGNGNDVTAWQVDISECVGDVVTTVEAGCNTSAPPVGVSPLPANNPELCITDGTRIALEDNTLLVFSDFRDTTNGMPITHIPLQSVPAPSDEQKAANVPVPLVYQDSEYAPGWSVALYWQNNHYGVIVYKDGGKTIYEDTGAICGWF
jgi:hypothetical protein